MQVAVSLVGSLVLSNALATQFDEQEYTQLLAEASAKTMAPVMISLDNTITLTDLSIHRNAIKKEMEQKAQALLLELNAGASTLGYWNNGMGQMGVYLNADSLRTLAKSRNARRFERDSSRSGRVRASNNDGSLDAIEAMITAKGFANVEVFLNVDALEYDLSKDGKTHYRLHPELSAQIEQRIEHIQSQGFAGQIKNLKAVTSRPSFHTRIDRVAFYGLRDSNDVRAIRPLGHVDTRLGQWPKEVLKIAQKKGEVDVIISLRGGDLYSSKTGYMSKKAVTEQSKANRRAFEDIFSTTESVERLKAAKHFDSIGAIHTRLPYQTILRLYESADPRVLQVALNKPDAKLTLNDSTVQINMQSAWDAGFRAAGQNIIIIDSGIRKDHVMFMNNGVSRVIFEACFGTTGVDGNNTVWTSICPNSDTNGDSPLGLLNSGEPNPDLANCATLAQANIFCAHGTHVAGIAAGNDPDNLQGVALDANLVAVQVSSYGIATNNTPRTTVFNADILAALQAVENATVSGASNPYVVNMSLGGGSFSSDCTEVNVAIGNIINTLISRGVPVVVATANNGFRDSIGWPACSAGAIKVSAVHNDANGITVANFANIGNPDNYTGPILLAPGGGGGTAIESSGRDSTTHTFGLAGTSQATPHVAGLYAIIKAAVPGISVNNASSWIRDSASIAVTVGSNTYRRIQVPNL